MPYRSSLGTLVGVVVRLRPCEIDDQCHCTVNTVTNNTVSCAAHGRVLDSLCHVHRSGNIGCAGDPHSDGKADEGILYKVEYHYVILSHKTNAISNSVHVE